MQSKNTFLMSTLNVWELKFSDYPWGVNLTDPPGIKLPWQLYRSNWSFISIYRNERALWSKSKTWNELKFSDLPPRGKSDPPMWNCQRTEWTLYFSMWPMRAHSKQSTNRKISGKVCEARAKLEMSSNFQIYPQGGKSDPPIWNCQRTEWTLH